MSHHPKISVIKNLTTSSPSDIVFIGIYKDKTLTPSGNDLSTDIKSGFDSAIKSGDVKGKTGELNFFYVDHNNLFDICHVHTLALLLDIQTYKIYHMSFPYYNLTNLVV